ncbi:hypothetical protein H0H87_001845, partial [Tephrocybe sp. NHM501043]
MSRPASSSETTYSESSNIASVNTLLAAIAILVDPLARNIYCLCLFGTRKTPLKLRNAAQLYRVFNDHYAKDRPAVSNQWSSLPEEEKAVWNLAADKIMLVQGCWKKGKFITTKKTGHGGKRKTLNVKKRVLQPAAKGC